MISGREDDLIKQAIEKARKLLKQPGYTHEELAQQIGIARGTLNRLLGASASVRVRSNTLKSLKEFLRPDGAAEDQVHHFFQQRLGVQSGESTKLLQGIPGHYLVYKLYSKGGSVLVTHMTVSVKNEQATFIDRSYILSPFGSSGEKKQAESTHRGMVFHRRAMIYFLSAEGSNLRLLAIDSQGLFSFSVSNGLLLGTNSDFHPYSTRVHLRRVNETEAKRLRGHFVRTDRRVTDYLRFIDNDMGSLKVLVGIRPVLGEQE